MTDHSIESDEDPRDYSLMREHGIDTGLDSNEAINSLTRQVETVSQSVGALATLMSDFILVMKSQANEGLSTTDGKSLSVLTPPKVPDAIKFNSLDTDHIVSRLFEVEFYIGQLPPGSPPVKAGQLVTGYAHELIMQEIRSGRFAPFGINHGQGPLEWCSLADMDFTTLKSILIMHARPQSTHQLRQKLRQIPVQISDKVLKDSMIFSQATRLNVVKKYLEEIKKFKDLFYPDSLQLYSKANNKLATYPMDAEFLPIFKAGDDKDDPISLLKILEKTLVVDKPVLSKSMFTSIFSSVTSSETFIRSLLQTVNKVVFEAAAQSGDKATVAKLEGYRRDSVASPSSTDAHPAAAFDVEALFYTALNVKPTEQCHPKYLFVRSTEDTPWTQGLLNVAFFNIRVLQEFQLRIKELYQRMHTATSLTRSSLQQLSSITPDDLHGVAEQQLINSFADDQSQEYTDYRYGDQLDFAAISAHFNHISSQHMYSLNASKPYSIEKNYSSNGGGGRAQQGHRKTNPCYKYALRGSCEDQNCRFSHDRRDIERLQGDPGYKNWCQKVKTDLSASNLEVLYQLAVAEAENLRQHNQQLSEQLTWKPEDD